jgi:hypothetical protein
MQRNECFYELLEQHCIYDNSTTIQISLLAGFIWLVWSINTNFGEYMLWNSGFLTDPLRSETKLNDLRLWHYSPGLWCINV